MMHRRSSGSFRNVKLRNERRHGRSTALFAAFDLKPEAAFDEAGHALHDPPAGLFRAHVDVAVIRVAHEPVAASLELAVQFIQHEVREQRRERPAFPARSSDQPCLISDICSSGRDFAPRFLQTVPRGSALALR